ncbi:MAG: hypothetical protein JNK07_07985 [Alphaproteobacteria bacterium]|nr:hypothetical protein [Alphaproteobacteria bacterium]
MSTSEPASPACSAHTSSDSYMGYADPDELVKALNALLEAERAGARVAVESLPAARTDGDADLIRVTHRDEGHWCEMLVAELRRLGVTPTTQTGAFYGKAMAIMDIVERLAFLNRGQAWVVRKLEELLPRVRNNALHANLVAMLDSHTRNIAALEAKLATRR